MTVGQYAASLALGILWILLPVLIFISTAATCVYVARWWIDRKG
jgi:hypothetical protein